MHVVMRESDTSRVESVFGKGPEEALMRVAIAGAGNVGRSIAAELLENDHEVLLIDSDPHCHQGGAASRTAEWLLADACEIASLDEAALQRCHVVIAATGDDKVNLVVSLLAKTEYGVPRVVARVNHPEQRVAVQRGLGRRRRRLHTAADVRPRRGGGQRR